MAKKKIEIFDFNWVNVAKLWHVAGLVNIAISKCIINI